MRPPVTRPLNAIVEEQIRKWNTRPPLVVPPPRCSVIAISREPGTRARVVAQILAKRLDYDLYGSNIVDEVARSAQCSEIVARSLDERGRSFADTIISSLNQSLNADEYLFHLTRIIAAIARNQRAIIIGRGAAFILPTGTALRVRFVAPLDLRVENFVNEFNIPIDEARQRIHTVANNRRKFVKDSFKQDIDDPTLSDLIINDEQIPAESAADMILVALRACNA